MSIKNSAHYQREFRRRLREQGLVKKEVWIRPENSKQLSIIEKSLRLSDDSTSNSLGASVMKVEPNKDLAIWNTGSLFNALQAAELFSGGAATIELIDGVAPSLYMVMHEFGDLPIFLSVSGEQILVDSVLWAADDVIDSAKFNEAILRTHKFIPLSTISLDRQEDGQEYYVMFGALSATSVLPNILFEIEVLASNVIQATEAYGNLLSISLD